MNLPVVDGALLIVRLMPAGLCSRWLHTLPALNLVATPGRRRATLDIAARDRAARLCRDFGVEPVQQHGAMPGPRLRDRAHSIRHRDRADLCRFGRGIRQQRRLSARGVGRPLPVRHRRRARPGASAPGGDAGPAARRHSRLCRQDPRRRGDRRAAADHPRRAAPAHGGARRRDRRRRRLRQRQPLAHGGIPGGAPRGQARRPGFLRRQPHPHLHLRRRGRGRRRCCGARSPAMR